MTKGRLHIKGSETGVESDFALNLTVATEPAQPLESGHKFYSYDCQEQVRKERGLGGQPKWGGY